MAPEVGFGTRYVHKNNVFVNSTGDRYIFTGSTSTSLVSLNSNPIVPTIGDTVDNIDDSRSIIDSETSEYIVLSQWENQGSVTEIINNDTINAGGYILTRQIPTIIPKPTTTEGKIEYIYNAYKDIKSAIEEKGGSVGSDISEYAEAIRKLNVQNNQKYILSLSGWNTSRSADISITVNGSITSYNTTTTQSISQEVDKDSNVSISIKDNTAYGTYITRINDSNVSVTKNTSFIMDKDYAIKLYTTDGKDG